MLFYKYATLIIVLASMYSCTAKQTDTGGHSHDELTIPLSGYSKKVEVFVDVQPMAVGANSQLIAHFTDLNSFKPIDVPEVSVALIVGNKGLRVTSKEQAQKGIHKLLIQPSTAGVGRLEFDLNINGTKHQVTIKNVEVYSDAHDAVHLAEAKVPSSPNGITFTKEQAWKVDFMTKQPEIKPFGNVIKASAQVSISPAFQTVVAARSRGFVQFTSGLLATGQEVERSESLMTISGKGLAENSAVVRRQEAKLEYDLAKADYERDTRLNSQKIVSNKALLESKARFEKAKANWSNLQTSVNVSGENVVAKTAGFLHKVLVNNGEFVEAGTPLFSIVQSKRMLIKAMVRPSALGALSKLDDANIELNDGSIVSLAKLNGRIISVAQSTDDDSYLLPVSFEIDYNYGLTPGGFTTVHLKTKSEMSRLVVPNSALVETQGLFFVYKQLTPELFERVQVYPGATDGMCSEITKGLIAEERIVTRGATFVKLAAVSNAIDPHAGHVH